MSSDVKLAKVVILALGNRFRGDDAVGPVVLDHLAPFLQSHPQVQVFDGVDDAMAILNAWDGANLAMIVDAAVSGAPPGTVHRLRSGEKPLPKEVAGCSSHGLGLAEAIELGTALNRLPIQLRVWAIEAAAFEPGEPLTKPVSEAARSVAKELSDLLRESTVSEDSRHA